MQLLILGATGMLGHKLFQILRQRMPDTWAVARANVRQPPFAAVELLQNDHVISGIDVLDWTLLESRLREWQPACIINAVGVIKQRPDAKSPIPSLLLNALLPHRLAAAAESWGGRVIHFSTDCVFNGRRGAYTEADLPDAEDLYGRTKFLGEVATPNALSLRTSIIGRELTGHKSMLDWFRAQNHGTIKGFTHAIYSGITTNEMADFLTMTLQRFPSLAGLYHLAATPISKFDLLHLIREAYGLDIQIQPDEQFILDRSMQAAHLHAATGYTPPSWPDMIRHLASDPTPYKEWGIP